MGLHFKALSFLILWTLLVYLAINNAKADICQEPQNICVYRIITVEPKIDTDSTIGYSIQYYYSDVQG